MITVSSERVAVATVVSGTAAMLGYVGLRACGLPWGAALIVALLLGAAGGWYLAQRLPVLLDGQRLRRPLACAIWVVLALLALGQTARTSAFMIDPTRTQQALMPWDRWLTEHSCLTAYTEAVRLNAAGAPNVYDPKLYSDRTRRISGFRVDLYHYPPPFLLVPLAVQAVVGSEYAAIRGAWFALSGLMFMLAFGLVARRLDGNGLQRAIFVAPALWLSIPVQQGLQMSNVQILVLSVAIIAMLVMARRPALGGALLALTIVSKLFPGVLVLYLAAQRRWRALAWTAGFAFAFCALALPVLGSQSFHAFVGFELPRLSSGEAFASPFAREFAVARNMSPFGIAIKVAKLGVPALGTGLAVGRGISLAFGLVLASLAIWAGRTRRTPSSGDDSLVVLALLALASLASPFAPGNYVLVPLVWLVLMHPRLGRPGSAVPLWLLISLPFFVPREVAFAPQMWAFLPAQVLALAVPAAILWQAGRTPATEARPKGLPAPAMQAS
jgi:hypothetical protein